MAEPNTLKKIVSHPGGQAVALGALTLIPARKYPAWLCYTFTWGTTLSVVAVAAVPGATSAAAARVSEQEKVDLPEASPSARAAIALGLGALTYGTWKFSWWFDDAAERSLRTLRVPFPRAAMGVAVGAFHYRSEIQWRRTRAGQGQASQTSGEAS